MSRLLSLLAIAGLVVVGSGLTSFAQTRVVTRSTPTETYRCSKCGKLHTRPVSTVTTTSTRVTSSSTSRDATSSPSVAAASDSKATSKSTGTVKTVSAEIPMASSSQIRPVRGVINVLAELNAQRSRLGVRPLRFDPALQQVAQRRAQQMASSGMKGHPPGSFSPGRYEGVGWSSTYSPSRVSACYTSDSRMQYAGAAMATGRDGVYFAVVYR